MEEAFKKEHTTKKQNNQQDKNHIWHRFWSDKEFGLLLINTERLI